MMMTFNAAHTEEKKKTLIAMAAAMGAGCDQCAEKLCRMGLALKIPAADMRKAFWLGLNSKAQAVNSMRATVSALLQRGNGEQEPGGCGSASCHEAFKKPGKMEHLIRIASYAAANSAADALAEIDEALAEGADNREIDLCLSTARMVREKAAVFSDERISATRSEWKAGKDVIEAGPDKRPDDSPRGCKSM